MKKIILAIAVLIAIGAFAYAVSKNEHAAPLQSDEYAFTHTCTPDMKPWIRIATPNGGERYYMNEALVVDWSSCNIPMETLMRGELVGITIPQGAPITFCQTDDAECPSTFQNGGSAAFADTAFPAPGSYKVRISVAEDPNISDISDKSFIVSSENAPTQKLAEHGDDINGQHFGYIKDISLKDGVYTASVDYFTFRPCTEGEECQPAPEIINDDPTLHILPIASDAHVAFDSQYIADMDDTGYWGDITVPEFASLYHEYDYVYYWITIENGVITDIQDIYQT